MRGPATYNDPYLHQVDNNKELIYFYTNSIIKLYSLQQINSLLQI